MRQFNKFRKYVKIYFQKNTFNKKIPKYRYQENIKKPLIITPLYQKLNTSLLNKYKKVSLTSQRNIERVKRSLSSSREEDVIKREQELRELKLVMRDKTLSYYQKLTILFKQYGKVLVTVHIVTSIIWLGAIYKFVNVLVKVFCFL